jgi:hypothetical protein
MVQDLDICVMAVPERMKHVKEYLVPRLGKLSKNVLVFQDKERKGAWWNCKRIYTYNVGKGRPKLVIQDDVLLRDDFDIHIVELLNHLSKEVQAISLFTPPRGSFSSAFKEGVNALRSWKLVWPPMMLVTDDWCKGVVQNSRFMNDKEGNSTHDDTKMHYYAHASGNAPLIVCVSLAQHDTSVASAQGNPNKLGALERKSATYHTDIPSNYYKVLNVKEEGNRHSTPPYSR